MAGTKTDLKQSPIQISNNDEIKRSIERHECSVCGTRYERYCPVCARFDDEDRGLGRMGDE